MRAVVPVDEEQEDPVWVSIAVKEEDATTDEPDVLHEEKRNIKAKQTHRKDRKWHSKGGEWNTKRKDISIEKNEGRVIQRSQRLRDEDPDAGGIKAIVLIKRTILDIPLEEWNKREEEQTLRTQTIRHPRLFVQKTLLIEQEQQRQSGYQANHFTAQGKDKEKNRQS